MADEQRKIMIAKGFWVPAVPAETLRAVYGQRTPDPYVEFVGLTVRYYVDSGATRPLIRERVLAAMPGRITSANVWDLVSLLAKLRLAEEFFDLASLNVDRDGAFRRFLLDLDPVLADALRHYSAWNAINPKLFFDGFVVGVAESFATVVVDLGQLAKLVVRLHHAQFSTLYELTTDPAAGLARLDQQATMVRQAFAGIIKTLDPRNLPAKVVQTWQGWETEFGRHLENSDPYAAGKLLGRIAGDLWQLLTGLAQLSKLIGKAVKSAVQYAPLLVGTLRGAGAQVALLTRQLAELLTVLGKAAVAAAPRVGMEILHTLFPPEVMRALAHRGRAFVAHAEYTLTTIFQAPHAQAFAGAGAGTPYGYLVSQESNPLFMAAVSETVSSAGRPATPAELNKALGPIMAGVDKAFAALAKPARAADMTQAAVNAARSAQMAQRLTTHFNTRLQQVAYETFLELRKAGRVEPWQLGQMIHKRMADEITQLVAEAAPGLVALPETTLRESVRLLKTSSDELKNSLQASAEALEEPVARMLLRHEDSDLLLRLIGFEAGPAKNVERSLARHLSERFGWQTTTRVGDLRSDLLLVDPGNRVVTNVDWTSSTKLEAFERTWGKVADDLGTKFDGKWEAIAEAYRQASAGGVPAEVVRDLERLTTHAVRETVIRRAALQSVFGKLWYAFSHEMTYKGLNSLFKAGQ
ncbi:hypothetical protein [Streptomyces sp. PAN_FS17]|uniref:hypothetical protein n=1 Tax=Streptomyces sp. PAN_FS17 TaxID=1855351 RepID=UPI0008949B44|nr:hypothetical protein [Streptomyces sp. PAN_FS17]SEE10059.1 hypothetical protein SAMN05216482_9191 [Streptomyces sp. PAN_FS17]